MTTSPFQRAELRPDIMVWYGPVCGHATVPMPLKKQYPQVYIRRCNAGQEFLEPIQEAPGNIERETADCPLPIVPYPNICLNFSICRELVFWDCWRACVSGRHTFVDRYFSSSGP
jgi:hypothetical protein